MFVLYVCIVVFSCVMFVDDKRSGLYYYGKDFFFCPGLASAESHSHLFVTV